jgi:hypothetical protein
VLPGARSSQLKDHGQKIRKQFSKQIRKLVLIAATSKTATK